MNRGLSVAGKLAAYIEQDLRTRIRADRAIPEKLTLAALAREYGVSTTPVRLALARLVADDVIRKDAGGRLTVNPAKIGTGVSGGATGAPPPTADDRDRALLWEVMLASLGDESLYLREETLARRHGVGRSIIRQGLLRLAGAGLLEHVPRRGWLVRPLRQEDVHAFLAVREVLELKAMELARPRLQRRDLEQMLAANAVPVRGQAPELNNELHEYFVAKSGNRYIRAFFGQYIARYYTALFDYATPEMAVVAEQARRHRKILQALLAGDWAAARHELSAHIRSQADVLRPLLARADA